MKVKQLSPAAIVALKDALSNVYWYKKDLKSFLLGCRISKVTLNNLDWSVYKHQIASDLIDIFIDKQDHYIEDLTKLCYELTEISDFSHLKQLEDGGQKILNAQLAIKRLKSLVEPHKEQKVEQEKFIVRQEVYNKKIESNAAIKVKLEQLNKIFLEIAAGDNPQQKGYKLEKFMQELFVLFDLDPKASFKILGEQIDGAFILDGTNYLFEAKWQNNPIGASELAAFSSKVTSKLENTLGVFLSMNDYSSEGITAHCKNRPSIILMDGADLMAVLDQRIDFVSLLLKKKRHASQTGNIYLKIHEILS